MLGFRRRAGLAIAVIAAMAGATPLPVGAERGTRVEFVEVAVDGGTPLPVALHLPDGFDPIATYPVVVGPGDGRSGGTGCICWSGLTDDRGWIRVESGALVRADRRQAAAALVGYLRERFVVEGNRVHAVGFSANSAGAFGTTLESPELFHSVVALPGHPRTNAPDRLRRLATVRVRMIVGSEDGYWLRAARESLAAMRALDLDADLEIIDGGGHVLEEIFGDPLLQRLDGLRPGCMQAGTDCVPGGR